MFTTIALTLHFAGFLCDSDVHALAFADIVSAEQLEEIAANEVGKNAQKQVCGFYAGNATEVEKTRVLHGSAIYQITRYLFPSDGRVAYRAERTFDAGESLPREQSF